MLRGQLEKRESFLQLLELIYDRGEIILLGLTGRTTRSIRFLREF